MYRFSLHYFIRLFQRCLTECGTSATSQEDKLESQSTALKKISFNSVASSLFKQDRLIFGLHFVHGTFTHLFEPNEWEFFLGNAFPSTTADATRLQLPKWLTSEQAEKWAIMQALFPKLAQSINFSDSEWLKWYHDIECEVHFPPALANRLSEFQRILLVQVFRTERLQTAINNFVC